jgi:hypothetical protein
MPTYTPLPNGKTWIRILLLQKNPREALLQGSLMLCPLSELPRYEALSYVWGKDYPNPDFTISCDGEIWPLSKNLHNALSRIMESTPEGDVRNLWVDQICINQSNEPDNKEKALQLQLMGEIYSKAENALVWLGNPPPEVLDVEGCVELLPSIIKGVDTATAQTGGPNFQPSARFGFPPEHHPVWKVAKSILYAEWYSRLWTFQEAVLATKIVVLHGSAIFDWDLVAKLYKAYASAPLLPGRRERSETEQAETRHQYVRWINTYRTRKERSLPNPLYSLLSIGALKKCKEPEDRVYGVLGMLENSVKDLIEVDYSKPLSQIYLEAFKVAIDSDPNLHLLSLCFERGGMKGLPTWCPDLTRLNGCTELPGGSYHAGRKASNPTDASVAVLPHSNYLRVQGVEVDRISSIVQADFTGYSSKDKIERQRLLRAFRDESLQLAQSVYRTDRNSIPEPHWQTLVGGVTAGWGGTPEGGLPISDALIGYKSHFNGVRRTQKEIGLGMRYISTVFAIFERRKYIATTNGRVGVAPRTCRIGDIICVFQGARLPFVLRPNDDKGTTFSFVGDCYVYGLMESEALGMVEEGKLRFTDFVVT